MKLLVKSTYPPFIILEISQKGSWSPYLHQVITLHLWKILSQTSCLGAESQPQGGHTILTYFEIMAAQLAWSYQLRINSRSSGLLHCSPLCITSCQKLLRPVIYFTPPNKSEGFASYRQDSIGPTLAKWLYEVLGQLFFHGEMGY